MCLHDLDILSMWMLFSPFCVRQLLRFQHSHLAKDLEGFVTNCMNNPRSCSAGVGRDACFTIVCILCADHVFWYPWFLCREFTSAVSVVAAQASKTSTCEQRDQMHRHLNGHAEYLTSLVRWRPRDKEENNGITLTQPNNVANQTYCCKGVQARDATQMLVERLMLQLFSFCFWVRVKYCDGSELNRVTRSHKLPCITVYLVPLPVWVTCSYDRPVYQQYYSLICRRSDAHILRVMKSRRSINTSTACLSVRFWARTARLWCAHFILDDSVWAWGLDLALCDLQWNVLTTKGLGTCWI